MINEAFLIEIVSVLATALISGFILALAFIYKKDLGIQNEIRDLHVEVYSKKPSKLSLHLLITIVLFFNIVIFTLWVYILSWWFSSQIGHLQVFSIILYTIAVITFVSLISIFYENLRSSLSIAGNVFREEPGFSLSSSIAFGTLITVIYGYSLSAVNPINHNPNIVYPHNPHTYYLHLAFLIFLFFLIISKRTTFKDMGFIFVKDTSIYGLFMGVGLCFLMPLFYLRAFFLHETLEIYLRPPLSYFILVIILAPFIEEAFFRGILQAKLQTINRLHGFLALFLASLAYALFHVPKILFTPEFLSFSKPLTNYLEHPVFPFLYFLLVGLYFGDLYRTTKSIYWPILAHIILNIILYIFIIS